MKSYTVSTKAVGRKLTAYQKIPQTGTGQGFQRKMQGWCFRDTPRGKSDYQHQKIMIAI